MAKRIPVTQALANFNRTHSPPTKAMEEYAADAFHQGFIAGMQFARAEDSPRMERVKARIARKF